MKWAKVCLLVLLVGTDGLKAELARVGDERNEFLKERDTAKAELETKSKTLCEMSLRLDGIAKIPSGNGDASQSVGLHTDDPTVVKHINNLQEQLCAERQKNRQLKGA